MTNRDYLNKCSNREFIDIVLRKAAELETDYCNNTNDKSPAEVCRAIETDFLNWLDKEVTH